jgi:hypothetical protein
MKVSLKSWIYQANFVIDFLRLPKMTFFKLDLSSNAFWVKKDIAMKAKITLNSNQTFPSLSKDRCQLSNEAIYFLFYARIGASFPIVVTSLFQRNESASANAIISDFCNHDSHQINDHKIRDVKFVGHRFRPDTIIAQVQNSGIRCRSPSQQYR